MESSTAERLDAHHAVVAPGQVVAGRYKVRKEIARGGMSAILAAEDLRLGRLVALKVLLPHYRSSERIVDCFVSEARSLARISSRHVVSVFDQGAIGYGPGDRGLPFLVLELLDGVNLRTYAVEHWPLTLAKVARFGMQACEGIADIHACGITHQDIKPDNLFVSFEPDGSECIKVLDLGIALLPGVPRDRGAHGAGSPGYMSPEQQKQSSDIDARSDIWSLGAVLYELFAGYPPFDQESFRASLSRVLGDDAPRLGDVRPDLPLGIALAIERCLENDRSGRPRDIAELATHLAPYAEEDRIDEAGRIRHRLERVTFFR